jgi:hypothetical protein
MDIGAPGAFDDNGLVITSVIAGHQDELLAYYAGFELSLNVRYRIFTGLAISTDEGHSFQRVSQAPLLDRADGELLFRCGPFVLREQGRYRMWYVAGDGWIEVDGKHLPVYRLHYCESDDGRLWPRRGALSLVFDSEDEHGFGRPWVLPLDDRYQLFYSIRSRRLGGYKLGYAESVEGLDWKRLDEDVGLEPSPGSFDGTHVMYAAVLPVGDDLWCFYNGDNFGEAGFGVARLDR